MDSPFDRDYRRVITQLAALDSAADAAGGYVDSVESAINSLVDSVVLGTANTKGIDYAKGDAAEFWHAGTLDLDATRRGLESDVWTPRDTSPSDIAFGIARADPAQVKYYKTAEDTARAISRPDYAEMTKVVPSDQLDGVKEEAARLASRNVDTRPLMSDSYADTARNATDHLSHGGAESRPLTESDSRHLVQEARQDGDLSRKEWGLSPQQVIQLEDLAREALNAGAHAAALSAALQLAPIVITAIQQSLRNGELDLEELGRLCRAAPVAALRSGISGAVTAALVTATRSGMLGEALVAVPPGLIAATVVLAINSTQTAFRAARGEITWSQASLIIAQDGLVLTGSMIGGVLGQAIIPVPLLGAVVGNLVGATLARVAVGGGSTLLMGLAVERGWTIFGLVDQDYSLPPETLQAVGWELLDVDPLNTDPLDFDTLDVEPLDVEPFSPNGVSIRILRRGMIEVGKFGYI